MPRGQPDGKTAWGVGREDGTTTITGGGGAVTVPIWEWSFFGASAHFSFLSAGSEVQVDRDPGTLGSEWVFFISAGLSAIQTAGHLGATAVQEGLLFWMEKWDDSASTWTEIEGSRRDVVQAVPGSITVGGTVIPVFETIVIPSGSGHAEAYVRLAVDDKIRMRAQVWNFITGVAAGAGTDFDTVIKASSGVLRELGHAWLESLNDCVIDPIGGGPFGGVSNGDVIQLDDTVDAGGGAWVPNDVTSINEIREVAMLILAVSAAAARTSSPFYDKARPKQWNRLVDAIAMAGAEPGFPDVALHGSVVKAVVAMLDLVAGTAPIGTDPATQYAADLIGVVNMPDGTYEVSDDASADPTKDAGPEPGSSGDPLEEG